MPILRQIKIGGGNCRVYRVGLVYGARLCPGTGSRLISLAFRGALLAHGISAARTAVVHDRDRASEHSRHWCEFTRGECVIVSNISRERNQRPRGATTPNKKRPGGARRTCRYATAPEKGTVVPYSAATTMRRVLNPGNSVTSPYRDVGPPIFRRGWLALSAERNADGY